MATKSTRGKGEGGLYKRSDGLWVGVVDLPPGLDGKRRRKQVSSRDKGTAQKKLRDLLKAVERSGGDVATRTLRMSDWMHTYLDRIAPGRVTPTVLRDYQSVNRLYIDPLIGKKLLDRITADDVRRVHQAIMTTPRDPKLRDTDPADLPHGTPMLSTSYARKAHNLISGALKAAKAEGKVSVNICDVVDAPAARRADDNAFTMPQLQQLIAYLAAPKEVGDEIPGGPALWFTFLLTGARRGEVAGLEADRVGDVLDLSWQLQAITDVSTARADWEYRHVTGKRYLTRPKSRKGWRTPPLVEPLRSILHAHIEANPGRFVFTNDAGEPWYPTTITKLWKQMTAKAGLPPHVTLHGARHSFVDLLMNRPDAREDVVMQIVGHSSRAMTRSYRQHVDQSSARLALESAMAQVSF